MLQNVQITSICRQQNKLYLNVENFLQQNRKHFGEKGKYELSAFFPFSTMFSLLSKAEIIILAKFIFSSANYDLALGKSKLSVLTHYQFTKF